MKTPSIAVFHSSDHTYYADTCEPVRKAVERGELCLVARAHGSYPGLPLPSKTLPEVRSVGYWDAEHNQMWGLDWHRNEGIELTYLSRGKVDFAVDNQQFHLKRGNLTITRPWQLHRVGSPTIDACRLHFLILDVGMRRPNQPWRWPKWLVSSERDIARLTTLLSHNEQTVWEASAEVGLYFEKLGEAVAGYDEGRAGESYLKLYISGLVVALTELLHQQNPVLDGALSSAQRTVELFLISLPTHVDQEWDLKAMAAQCGLGRTRFAHYCKAITNMSPNEYLAYCRIQMAAQLLADEKEESITEVAGRCGFSSSQYFATVFRQYTSYSPSAFREQHICI